MRPDRRRAPRLLGFPLLRCGPGPASACRRSRAPSGASLHRGRRARPVLDKPAFCATLCRPDAETLKIRVIEGQRAIVRTDRVDRALRQSCNRHLGPRVATKKETGG